MRTLDTGFKLRDYFQLASLYHYIVVMTDRSMAVHHQRMTDSDIRTHCVTNGTLTLDPPGITPTSPRCSPDP
jgi:hypothetical protein